MLQHLIAADNPIKQQEMDTSCELSRHMQAGSRSCFLFFLCVFVPLLEKGMEPEALGEIVSHSLH